VENPTPVSVSSPNQRSRAPLSPEMRFAYEQKMKNKLAIPKYLEKVNDNFFSIVTAQQVFLNKMDKMKSKIRHKVKKMPTLIKGELIM
jgi:hypothetical protein